MLEESDFEEDDGQLENLSAFVDSLVSKTQKPSKEPASVAPKSNEEGYTLLK